jgi:7-carboxy-7-deazaguanine synthase
MLFTAVSGTHYVCVTGGEPLAQKRCPELLVRLCDEGYAVSLETSGAIDLALADRRVSRVMDLKTPDSGEVEKNLWSNIDQLTPHDQVKFVICSRSDYEWARRQLRERELAGRCEILFSPVWGQIDPATLADWVLDDRLPVRFQLQLHKLLWGEVAGK